MQVHYSREATANRVPGQPLVVTAPGVLESAPVVENVEVVSAAGSGGGHSDSDVSSRADCKQMAMGGPSGQIENRKQSPGAGASNIVDGPDLDGKCVVLQS